MASSSGTQQQQQVTQPQTAPSAPPSVPSKKPAGNAVPTENPNPVPVPSVYDPPRISFYDKGPGPAGYKLPPLVGIKGHALTHRINPAYSLAAKLPPRFLAHASPGPGKYGIPYGLKHTGMELPPGYTLRKRLPMSFRGATPGPADYIVPGPDATHWSEPKAVICFRHPDLSKLYIPGPETYMLPPMLGPHVVERIAAPEITMKGFRKEKEPAMSPGPIYDIRAQKYCQCPGFTIRKKLPGLKSQSCKAGPGSYDIQKARVWPKPPAWKFGIRYNDYTGVLRTQCDKSSYEPLDSY